MCDCGIIIVCDHIVLLWCDIILWFNVLCYYIMCGLSCGILYCGINIVCYDYIVLYYMVL